MKPTWEGFDTMLEFEFHMIFKQIVLIIFQQLNGGWTYKLRKTNHTRNEQVLLRNLQYIHHHNIWSYNSLHRKEFKFMIYEFESPKWMWLYLTKYLTHGLSINIEVQQINSLMSNNSINKCKIVNSVQLSVVGRKNAPPHVAMH